MNRSHAVFRWWVPQRFAPGVSFHARSFSLISKNAFDLGCNINGLMSARCNAGAASSANGGGGGAEPAGKRQRPGEVTAAVAVARRTVSAEPAAAARMVVTHRLPHLCPQCSAGVERSPGVNLRITCRCPLSITGAGAQGVEGPNLWKVLERASHAAGLGSRLSRGAAMALEWRVKKICQPILAELEKSARTARQSSADPEEKKKIEKRLAASRLTTDRLEKGLDNEQHGGGGGPCGGHAHAVGS
jgi:hypothetical protein